MIRPAKGFIVANRRCSIPARNTVKLRKNKY
jgi:hypothetical protein